jgi:hypothetical protein
MNWEEKKKAMQEAIKLALDQGASYRYYVDNWNQNPQAITFKLELGIVGDEKIREFFEVWHGSKLST